MTYLSDHFSLAELTVTAQRGLDNTPTALVIENLRLLAATLERARALLGNKPITITSGYRSPEVNRAIGGSSHSAHMAGLAADFICPGFGSPLAVARRLDSAGLNYDQLIYEGLWTHLSVDPRKRREALTAYFAKTGTTYKNGIIG